MAKKKKPASEKWPDEEQAADETLALENIGEPEGGIEEEQAAMPGEGEEEETLRIETRQYPKYLKCYLTDEQKADAAALLVQRMEEKTREQEELDSIKNQFKGTLARLDAEIAVKAGLVRDGYEFRDVACREEKDYERETFTITRLDTGEMVESRRLNPSEMQRVLPGTT